MACGLLLVQIVLAAVLAVLQRNQPATKLGDERVCSKFSSLDQPRNRPVCTSLRRIAAHQQCCPVDGSTNWRMARAHPAAVPKQTHVKAASS